MRAFWLLVHFVGFTLWIGGGLATMVTGVAAKSFTPAERLAAYRAIGRVQRLLIAPGAVFAVVSGFVLIMPLMAAGGLGPKLHVMMSAGVVGAIFSLFFSLPTANRLARLTLDPRGELPEAFAGLRKRQAIVATIAGALAIVALVAGTVMS
jgi:hypothetical protein